MASSVSGHPSPAVDDRGGQGWTGPVSTPLLQRRLDKGWKRPRLVREMRIEAERRGVTLPSEDAIYRTVQRHEKGTTVTDETYIALYCTVLDTSRHDLFGHLGSQGDTFAVTAHRFIPAFVGPDKVNAAADHLDTTDADLGPLAQLAWKAEGIDHPRGTCTLYGLPWGVLVYHLQAATTPGCIAELALARQEAHRSEPGWCANHLRHLIPTSAWPGYALSAYWVTEHRWRDQELDTAMRLLCSPRTLLGDGRGDESLERARVVEQTLLRSGFDDPDMINFGVPGASVAYASWAGVSYYALSAERALSPQRFVELEVAAQGLWTYCHRLGQQIEAGEDPAPPPGYGWRWLRGRERAMKMPRETETGQQKLAREAVVVSSGLDAQLRFTLDMLRDAQRE